MKNQLTTVIKRYWKDLFSLFLLFGIPVFVFRWVPHTYFQQDEWYFMGQSLIARTDVSIPFRIFSGMHFAPVEQLWLFFQYKIFWLDSYASGVISLCTHIVVIFLGYVLLRIFSVKRLICVVSLLFFALNPVSSQVVSWSPAAASGGVSVILFLLGILLWIINWSEKNVSVKILSGMVLFLSLFAKVDILTGFACVYIGTLFVKDKKSIDYKTIIFPLVLWVCIYMYFWMFGVKETAGTPHLSTHQIVSYIKIIPSWMGNIILTHNTLKSVLQFGFGRYATYVPFIDNDPILKIVCMVTAGFTFLWYLITSLLNKISLKKVLVFPFLVILSLLPYIFSISNGLESRYFYNGVFITGLWITVYLHWMIKSKHQKIYKGSIAFLVLLISFFSVADQPYSDYVPFQIKRKHIVTEMQKIVTPSPGTVVYYFENGSTSPFQSGIGHMLLVLQSRNDPSFLPYLKSYFLWGIFEEGYMSIGDKGFGYYFDRKRLQTDMDNGLFSRESIRAFVFDPYNRTILPNTKNWLQDL